MKFIVISGLSGAGKSVALHTLEDHHYYCIDNIPLAFLNDFSNKLVSGDIKLGDKVAVSIDARNLSDHTISFKTVLDRLAQAQFDIKVIFIGASEEALLRRYNETRRPHPLSTYQNLPLKECIKTEMNLLDEVIGCASKQIDTTDLNQKQLKQIIAEYLSLGEQPLSILLQSFGYKKGVPANSDYIFDVRCLPNPYWEAHLRPYTGTSPEIKQFLDNSESALKLVDDIFDFMRTWLPHFSSDTRAYLTISIGCTGGVHRSVYVVERLYEKFERGSLDISYNTSKQHRDL